MIIDRKTEVLQCEISQETNSSNSYPYFLEAYNTMTREKELIGEREGDLSQ